VCVCESLSIEGGEKENYFCFIIITSSLGMKTEKNLFLLHLLHLCLKNGEILVIIIN